MTPKKTKAKKVKAWAVLFDGNLRVIGITEHYPLYANKEDANDACDEDNYEKVVPATILIDD